MWRFLRDRRGDIFAYTGVLLAFMLVPLSSVAVDIVRGMYVRGHLHTATDAACQAAADALDASHFVSTGQARIKGSLARSQAGHVFYATLADSERVQYAPSISVRLAGPRTAQCTAVAEVARMIPGTPYMQVVTYAESQMRVSSLN